MVLFFSILISLFGVIYLAGTDPKRRRVFGQSELHARPHLGLARAAIFVPLLVLILLENWAGLALWGGALTMIGFAAVAVSPQTYAKWYNALVNLLDACEIAAPPVLKFVPRIIKSMLSLLDFAQAKDELSLVKAELAALKKEKPQGSNIAQLSGR